MIRIFYAIFKALAHYGCLRRLKRQNIRQLVDLSPKQLQEKQVACLALDFDGVLSAHGESSPNQHTINWLQSLIKIFPEDKVVILSNKPNQKRIDFFKQHFPQIAFILAQKKKPYPHGLEQIAKLKQVQPKHILLVDDRLLTGMLACCIAGTQGILVKKPYKRVLRRPIHELVFASLRTLERILIL